MVTKPPTAEEAFHWWTEQQQLWDESHEWPFKGGYESGRAEGRREGYAEALKDALARLRELYDVTNEPALSVAIEAVRALESKEA